MTNTPHLLRKVALAGVLFIVLAVLQHHKAYTADEVYELRNLSSSWTEVTSRPDGFPPLYTWVLGQFAQIFTSANARLLSALTASIGLLFIYSTGQRFGAATGFRAALFYAASACQLEYAQQARAYSLYIGLGSFVIWSAVRTVYGRGYRDWAFLVLSSVAILWTHYFAATFLVGVWLGVIIMGWRSVASNQRDRLQFIRSLVASIVASVIALIPWFAPLITDLKNPPPIEAINPVDLTGIAYTYLTLVHGWCVGPSQMELFEWRKYQAIMAIAPWALLSASFFFTLAVSAIQGNERGTQTNDSRDTQLFQATRTTSVWMAALIIGTPLLAASLAVIANSSFVGRYMAVLVVPYSLLCGMGSCFRPFSWSTVASYGLIAINLVSFANRNFSDRYDRENYRELLNFLQQQDNPQLLVLSDYLGNAIEYQSETSMPLAIVGLNSDEVDNWTEVRSRYSWLSSANSRLWIAADWMRPDDVRILRRDQILTELGAKPVMRISGTLELFSIPKGSSGTAPWKID